MNTAIELVEQIILRFGPRKAGSQAERNAQMFFHDHIKKYCHATEIHEFEDALTSKFQSLKVYCIGFYVALILYWFSIPAAFAVALINGIVFFAHFVLFQDWLDFLFPSKRSLNVIGTIEPEQEVKSTLIFSGHMDSTPEFIWWYWLKDWGIRLMLVSGFAFILLPVLYAVIWAAGPGNWATTAWWFFAATVPFTASFFFIHGKRVVDGAQDNLSGVAVADQVAKSLVKDGESTLQHTRVKVIAFGSEETGLKGSGAYAKSHREELKKEHAHLINLDGILEIDEMHIIDRELSIMQRHDKELVSTMARSFNQHGLPEKIGTIPVGATDASSFTRNGLPALSIVGMGMGNLHPTYHTRLDTIDCLTPSTLDKMSDILVDFAKEWDRSNTT